MRTRIYSGCLILKRQAGNTCVREILIEFDLVKFLKYQQLKCISEESSYDKPEHFCLSEGKQFQATGNSLTETVKHNKAKTCYCLFPVFHTIIK